MIEVAVSYGFGDETDYNSENIPKSIQLSLYKYELYEKYKEQIWNAVEKNKVDVKVVHLPIDASRVEFEKIFQIIVDSRNFCGCDKFVIHPNKMIESFINNFNDKNVNATLCIENFQWRRKKVFRSPLEIINRCITNDKRNLSMTLDTCHTEEVWFDNKIIPYILKNTSVIHLSNRSSVLGQHIPFNIQQGELNLLKFISDLKRIYKWNGIIVLEYMHTYSHYLQINYNYLKHFFGGK